MRSENGAHLLFLLHIYHSNYFFKLYCKKFASTKLLHYICIAMMRIDDIIKQAGLRATPQRRLVYMAMTELRHASIDDIMGYLASRDSGINLSTIYRILDSFCEAHLLSLVFHPTTGKCYYDITVAEHHHVYDDSGISDYDDPALSELVRQYLKEHNFQDIDIDKIQVQITINNNKPNKT